MKREVDLNEISDGRLYSSGDMVKVDCHDCEGCSACCQGMGDSILLDPMDLWRLQLGKKENFDTLLANYLELNVVDGMVLPNLKMAGEEEACPFLKDGRCSIHGYRPGICRLFPLGRIYEENGFKYFIQVYECKKQERGKVKIKKWLGIADQKRYEDFVWRWHTFLKNCEEGMKELDVMPDIMVTEDSIDTWQPAANFDFDQLAKQEILEKLKSTPTVENIQQKSCIEQKREALKAKLKNHGNLSSTKTISKDSKSNINKFPEKIEYKANFNEGLLSI